MPASPRRGLRPALILTLLSALAGCGSATQAERRPLALMSSLPLYWGEGADSVGAVLRTEAEPDWVRGALETRFALAPLDALDAASLKPHRYLLLAQPRPLAPEENVALDAWVREGGRVLLLADPLLTRHSDRAVGDPRRPQDTVLLSPILARWGLELRFDEASAAALTDIDLAGTTLPLALAGSLHPAPGAECRALAQPVLVRCKVGRGYAVVLADAAVLDDAGGRPALDRLLAAAFD